MIGRHFADGRVTKCCPTRVKACNIKIFFIIQFKLDVSCFTGTAAAEMSYSILQMAQLQNYLRIVDFVTAGTVRHLAYTDRLATIVDLTVVANQALRCFAVTAVTCLGTPGWTTDWQSTATYLLEAQFEHFTAATTTNKALIHQFVHSTEVFMILLVHRLVIETPGWTIDWQITATYLLAAQFEHFTAATTTK